MWHSYESYAMKHSLWNESRKSQFEIGWHGRGRTSQNDNQLMITLKGFHKNFLKLILKGLEMNDFYWNENIIEHSWTLMNDHIYVEWVKLSSGFIFILFNLISTAVGFPHSHSVWQQPNMEPRNSKIFISYVTSRRWPKGWDSSVLQKNSLWHFLLFIDKNHIDVDDGCWRQNALVTTLWCWWPI